MRKIREIAVNVDYGSYDLSLLAIKRLNELGVPCHCADDVPRDDPVLIKVIRELGQQAAGISCELGICKIPEDAEWEIEEYDGAEWVSERHRTWRGKPV